MESTKTLRKQLDDVRGKKLAKLGFENVVKKADEVKRLRGKLAVAYEHYRFVTPENINAFNEKLRKETQSDPEGYKHLAFVDIKKTELVPPDEVLLDLEKAQDKKCFDEYEITYIERVKDPILFGRVNGCDNRFFIGQWDEDVSIDDILAPNEG